MKTNQNPPIKRTSKNSLEKTIEDEILRQSEEKYKTLFNAIDQGLTLCELIRNEEGKGVDFYMLEVNPTYEFQTGVKKEMVLGKKMLEVFPSLDKWLEIYIDVVDNQRPVILERYFEETERWFLIKAYPIEKDRFAVLFSNITERKQAEIRFKENDLIFTSIPDAIISSDAMGRVTSWNEGAEALYGFNKEEMIGQIMHEIIPIEFLNKEQSNWHEIFALKGNLKGEVIQTCKDGKKIYVSVAAHIIHDTKGEMAGYVAVNRDITAQKVADIKIKESENRFRTMADASPMLIWTLDAKGLSSYYNKTFLDFLGESDEGDITEWKKLVHPDDYQFTLDTINAAIAEHRSYSVECRLRRADGQWRWWFSQGNSIIGPNNEFSGFIGSSVDITERKESESKLKESAKQLRALSSELELKVQQRTTQLVEINQELISTNKELEAFNYVSSHDMQEPLRKIQTFAGRILEKEHEHLSDSGKNYFRLMQQSAARMHDLLQDLLTFSRLGTAERKFETTNLNVIIEEVKEEFKDVIAEKKAVIMVKEICDVKIITFQFRQLMHNLISNALKFTNPDIPPQITIQSHSIKSGEIYNVNLSPQKEYCHISITDNGIGFEKEFEEKIFEVFQKLHGNDEYAGTGIGLAIVKKIVDNHNGFIKATSELSKGTTFNIYLPA